MNWKNTVIKNLQKEIDFLKIEYGESSLSLPFYEKLLREINLGFHDQILESSHNEETYKNLKENEK